MTAHASNQERGNDSPAVSRFAAPEKGPARLQAILNEIIKYYQQLLLVSQEEKRLIIDGDVEDLVSCLTKKEKVVTALKALEARRREEISLICPRNPEISLNALISGFPEKDREDLRSTQIRLEALTASIQDVNQMNGILVERVLQQITSLLDLLKQMAFPTVTYQPTGLIVEAPFGGKTIAKG